MIRVLLSLVAFAFLAGCGGLALPAPGLIPAAPAPLASTTVDEKGYGGALVAFDAALSLIDQKVAAGDLRGDKAVRVRKALSTAYTAIQAMKAARLAGSTTSLPTAIAEATAAVTKLRAIVEGK